MPKNTDAGYRYCRSVRWPVKHGYSENDVRQIGGGNSLRILRDTWSG